MKLNFAILLFILSFTAQAQTSPKQDMNYDASNMLYWKVTNDKENLYIKFYKDEYGIKALQAGGIKLYFNLEGKQDTLSVPNLKYPLYKEERNWEIFAVNNFDSIPNGEHAIANTYGILATSTMEQKERALPSARDFVKYSSLITIPLQYLKTNGTSIAIQILLRGMRTVAPTNAAVPRVLKNTNGASQEFKDYMYHVDTWSHCWLDYKIE